MTGTEIIMLLLISINGLVIAVEMISWTRYLNGMELRKKTDEYLNSEQFQKDKAERLEETYKIIDRIRAQKDAEMITKTNKLKQNQIHPKLDTPNKINSAKKLNNNKGNKSIIK